MLYLIVCVCSGDGISQSIGAQFSFQIDETDSSFLMNEHVNLAAK